MREKLIKLLNAGHFCWQMGTGYDTWEECVADHLLANGVIVLPCKVGDTVWCVRSYKGVKHPQEGKVGEMYFTADMRLHIWVKHIGIGEWGKKIFATREEAEAALKGR